MWNCRMEFVKWLACRQKNIIMLLCLCSDCVQCVRLRSIESFVAPENHIFTCLIMAGTGRQFFNESEKICLQELIIKYKLNSMATPLGNSAAKKISWARLTEEYNSIETNTKRTEAQLKKCWDNLKTRRKSLLTHEKRERMRTGGGSYNPKLPSTSSEVHFLDDALTDQTDVELPYVIDSDLPEITSNEDMQTDSRRSAEVTETQDTTSASRRDSLNETLTERDRLLHTPPRQTESHLTDYSAAPSQGSRNVRTRVIQEEFSIRQENYNRAQRRDEELHKLKMEEKVWMVKAAEENFLKLKAEREAAEEFLRCNIAKREEAELRLLLFKNKK